jgi:hypothetical protein
MVLVVTSIEQVDAPVTMTKVQVEAALLAISMSMHTMFDHRVEAVFRAYDKPGNLDMYLSSRELLREQYVALNNVVQAMPDEPRWYGVSFGNGNDGVSQSWPRCAVFTNEPFVLARAAMISQFVERAQPWANDVMVVDGEMDYTISATIYDPPEDDTDQGDDDDEPSRWSEFNGAWMICEVFPLEDVTSERCPRYDTLEAYVANQGNGTEQQCANVLAVARADA